MDFEFETKRTGLANAFADAGEALMAYMGVEAALAAIPNTEPQQYVVAGTLPMIAKMLPGIEPTSPAVAPSQVPAELTVERIDALWRHSCEVGGETTREYVRHFAKAVATEVRLSAVREARNEAQWISVTERMPEDGDTVLVFVPGCRPQNVWIDTWSMQREAPVEWSSSTVETGLMWDRHEFEEVTHWMPLPSAPASPAASKEGGASHG